MKKTINKQRWLRRGFTIVELLIVIVVIGILAAITLVSYNGIQNRAKQSAAQSATSQASKKLQTYFLTNADTYPPDLATAGITNSGDTTFQYSYNNSVNPKTYCITTTITTISYYQNNTTQPSPAPGGCPGHGVGGVAAVTNLVTNPSVVLDSSNYSPWGGNGGGVSTGMRVVAAWALRGFAFRNTWTVVNNAYNGDAGYIMLSTTTSLSPNTQYTAHWRTVTSKSQRISPAVGNWTIVGGAVGTGTQNASSGGVLTSAGVPVDQWITFTTGANTVGAKIYSQLIAGTGATYWAAGDYLEVSEFIVTQGSIIPNYADGSSPNWVWNGTPHNSTSTGPPL